LNFLAQILYQSNGLGAVEAGLGICEISQLQAENPKNSQRHHDNGNKRFDQADAGLNIGRTYCFHGGSWYWCCIADLQAMMDIHGKQRR